MHIKNIFIIKLPQLIHEREPYPYPANPRNGHDTYADIKYRGISKTKQMYNRMYVEKKTLILDVPCKKLTHT